LSWSGEGVLDGRVSWEQFGRKIVGREFLVVRREGVSLETEGTDPEFGSDVDLARRERVYE